MEGYMKLKRKYTKYGRLHETKKGNILNVHYIILPSRMISPTWFMRIALVKLLN